MADSYQPTYWVDKSTPAINATNLRKIEKGIADAHGIADGTIGSTGTVDRIIIIDGAGHYLQIPSLTTTQRNALPAKNGMILYNSTLKCLQTRRDGAWVDLHAGTIRENLNLGGNKITSLGAPIDDADAATKQYVDLRPTSSAIVANAYLSGASWYRTDPAKPAWMVQVDEITDLCRFFRAPAGSGAISWISILEISSVAGIRPRICEASNEIRYESLAAVTIGTSHSYGPVTGVHKVKRIPASGFYFFAENAPMSVRVTAEIAYTYPSFPTESPVIQFWIRVDGEIQWSQNVVNNETVEIAADVLVSPNSLVEMGMSRIAGSAYHTSNTTVREFRIRASDRYIDAYGW